MSILSFTSNVFQSLCEWLLKAFAICYVTSSFTWNQDYKRWVIGDYEFGNESEWLECTNKTGSFRLNFTRVLFCMYLSESITDCHCSLLQFLLFEYCFRNLIFRFSFWIYFLLKTCLFCRGNSYIVIFIEETVYLFTVWFLWWVY